MGLVIELHIDLATADKTFAELTLDLVEAEFNPNYVFPSNRTVQKYVPNFVLTVEGTTPLGEPSYNLRGICKDPDKVKLFARAVSETYMRVGNTPYASGE